MSDKTEFLGRFSWIIVLTAVLIVLGIVADLSGVLGLDVNQQITMRWLLIEVVVSGGVILVMAQLIIQTKQQLIDAGSSNSQFIEQLKKENDELHNSIKSIIRERELLQSAIKVIEVDRLKQFTDPEIAHLTGLCSGMNQQREVLSYDERLDILKQVINIACSDRDFRREQQLAVKEIGDKYRIEGMIVKTLIAEAEKRLYEMRVNN